MGVFTSVGKYVQTVPSELVGVGEKHKTESKLSWNLDLEDVHERGRWRLERR